MKPGRGIFCPFRVNPRIFSGPPTRLSLSVSSPALFPSLFVLAAVSCVSPHSIYQRLLRPLLLTRLLSFVSSLRHYCSRFLVFLSAASLRFLYLPRCEDSITYNFDDVVEFYLPRTQNSSRKRKIIAYGHYKKED